MKSSPLALRLVLLGWIGASGAVARAQVGVSPEAVPGRDEAASPAPELGNTPAPGTVTAGTQAPASGPTPEGSSGTPGVPGTSRLTAARVAYEGGTIVAQGDANNPAVFESGLDRLQANELRLDTLAQTVVAKGEVRLNRQSDVDRRELRLGTLEKLRRRERIAQTFAGQNLNFDFKTRRGTLDGAMVRSDVDLNADQLEINGQRFIGRGVVIRPGGLSDEERKIYGTPPLSLRAREVNITQIRQGRFSIGARGAGLYFNNTRLLPLPSVVLRYGSGGNRQDFRITPGISFNSADRVLVTTRLGFPLANDPRRLSLNANLGLSQKVGFRGGATLFSTQSFGDIRLAALRRDIVFTQLTNRLEVDRKPELTVQSRTFGTFLLPRFGRSGFSVDGSLGSFTERSTSGSGTTLAPVSSDRIQGRLLFTTRLDPRNGPFVRAFASTAHYNKLATSYDTTGVELGFAGRLMRRINGEVSLRLTRVEGQTPFQFDLIEIPRELRTTFDVELSPRYLFPVDVRYDLNKSEVRDATFGLLRSYKVFAYGVVYQTVRRDLRLEVRSAF